MSVSVMRAVPMFHPPEEKPAVGIKRALRSVSITDHNILLSMLTCMGLLVTSAVDNNQVDLTLTQRGKQRSSNSELRL